MVTFSSHGNTGIHDIPLITTKNCLMSIKFHIELSFKLQQ